MCFHPSVVYSCWSLQCCRDSWWISAVFTGWPVGYTLYSFITGHLRDTQVRQTCTHSLIPKGSIYRPINSLMHKDNMKSPCRTTPGRDSNPGPTCCYQLWHHSALSLEAKILDNFNNLIRYRTTVAFMGTLYEQCKANTIGYSSFKNRLLRFL